MIFSANDRRTAGISQPIPRAGVFSCQQTFNAAGLNLACIVIEACDELAGLDLFNSPAVD